VLDEVAPGHAVSADDIRPYLRDGYPWHAPDQAHPELSDPNQWWEHMAPFFANAYESVGVPAEERLRAAMLVRRSYCDPSLFRLYPDTVHALRTLRREGWGLVILSNHVPELESIVNGVGLGPLVDQVFSSARTGYEKPNPEAYRIALGRDRPSDCFMVGDNVEADVLGAERIGLPAILVRAVSPLARQVAPDLLTAAEIIGRR
jgi:putative hydrolase of the HAD superfamily